MQQSDLRWVCTNQQTGSSQNSLSRCTSKKTKNRVRRNFLNSSKLLRILTRLSKNKKARINQKLKLRRLRLPLIRHLRPACKKNSNLPALIGYKKSRPNNKNNNNLNKRSTMRAKLWVTPKESSRLSLSSQTLPRKRLWRLKRQLRTSLRS